MAKQSPSISESEYRFDRLFARDFSVFNDNELSNKTRIDLACVYEWEIRCEVVRSRPELKEYCDDWLICSLTYWDSPRSAPDSLIGNYKPFLDLTPSEKNDLLAYFRNPGRIPIPIHDSIKQIDFEDAFDLWKLRESEVNGLITLRPRAKENEDRYSSNSRVYSFIINWNSPESEIAKSFREWLTKKRKHLKPDKEVKRMTRPSKPFILLRNLAMLRLLRLEISPYDRELMLEWASALGPESEFRDAGKHWTWKGLADDDINKRIEDFSKAQLDLEREIRFQKALRDIYSQYPENKK